MILHLISVIFIPHVECDVRGIVWLVTVSCPMHLQKGQSLKKLLTSPSPPSFLWWNRHGLWTRHLMAVLIETCPAFPSPYPRRLLRAIARPVPHPAWVAAAAVLQYVPTHLWHQGHIILFYFFIFCFTWQKQSFSFHGHLCCCTFKISIFKQLNILNSMFS